MKCLDKAMLGAVYMVEEGVSFERQELDLKNMYDLGIRLVVLWPPVSRWDSEDGVSIAFDSIDRVMDKCAELGLKVVLEFEGQNPAFQFMPDNLYDVDYLPQSGKARHWVNYLHPKFNGLMRSYIYAVCHQYKDHPALYGYDLFNEVNFHSKDPHTEKAFQTWLYEKYGEVKKLNSIWGRFYTDFNQVCLKNLEHNYGKWSSLRPMLDFEDFRSDTIATLIKSWGKMVREVDDNKEHLLIADNSWSMTTFETTELGNDDWKVARAADVFGLSIYPQSWGLDMGEDPAKLSQLYRGGICAGGDRPIMISELQTHNQTALASGSSCFDELKLWTWQAFALGAEALVYWKWNPFTRGFQVSGRGMTAQDGRPNIRAEYMSEVASVINANAEVLTGRTVFDSGVAILYCPTNDRFTDIVVADDVGLYRNAIEGWYRLLWAKGINPSIIQANEIDVKKQKVLIIPALAVLSSADAKIIQEYIETGGNVIAEGRFAIVDENGFAYDRAPGNLTDTFGYQETDFFSPYKDETAVCAKRFCVIELNSATTNSKTKLNDATTAQTKNTLYIPTFFGNETTNKNYASLVDEFITPLLDTSFEIIKKPALVDVAISTGKGVLISVCNFSSSEEEIVVRVPSTDSCRTLWAGHEFACEEKNGTTIITAKIPARAPAGFLFE